MRRLRQEPRDRATEARARARRLARDARAKAEHSGHALGRFRWDEWDGRAHCTRCEAFVAVRLVRRVDELEVWGTAFVAGCPPRRRRT